ncbi:MAG: DUF4399 domain-containing protein [Dokdonella sp.]
MRLTSLCIAFAALFATLPASAADPTPAMIERTKAPAGVELYFISPRDGETLGTEVTVTFGLKGMGVAPAGITLAKTGHHHLLIDLASPPPVDAPIPADAQHVHFGGGQTQTTVKLTPGEHTLQLNLGDALHRQFDPPILSEKITITVK